MRARLPAVVLGLVLGILGTVGFQAWKTHAVRTTLKPASNSDEVQRLQTALAKAEARVKSLEREKARLVAEKSALEEGQIQLQPNEPKPAKPAQTHPLAKMMGGGSPTNDVGAAVSKMVSAAMRQQAEMKVAAMKLRLGLSEEQEEAVRALLTRQLEHAAEMTGKMFGGKMSSAQLKEMGDSAVDLRTGLRQILTAEQWSEYEAYEVEERRNHAQMAANMEVMQLQSMLQLSESQQDQVFEALYKQYDRQMTESGDPHGKNPVEARDMFAKMLEQKKNALQAVLTAEQFAQYEKFLAMQQSMIEAFMPSFEDDDAE